MSDFDSTESTPKVYIDEQYVHPATGKTYPQMLEESVSWLEEVSYIRDAALTRAERAEAEVVSLKERLLDLEERVSLADGYLSKFCDMHWDEDTEDYEA